MFYLYAYDGSFVKRLGPGNNFRFGTFGGEVYSKKRIISPQDVEELKTEIERDYHDAPMEIVNFELHFLTEREECSRN